MQYRIEIKPGKEEAFLQLLQSWQALGVVTRFERFDDDDDDASQANKQDFALPSRQSSAEQAKHYRDLVD
ncbi:MAG: hypothetical protein HUU34_15530 [Saprospiraceae bacterium]|jgi:hypothetical protein|nr:hypothetical protein [Saprospiraceae bacterium]